MRRWCPFFLTVFFALNSLSADQVRAAFDVGSGQTKITVAVVDELSGRPKQVLFAEETVVLVGHDFKKSKNGTLSDAVLSELKNVLLHYRDIAKGLGAEDMAGVATAVFRESKNGGEFIQKMREELGIGLKLISQAEEGRMGFLTAVAASGKQPHEIVAWDSGGGSFQITNEGEQGLCVYEGPWGASKVLAAIVDKVQGKDFTKVQTANPASLKDIKALHAIVQNTLRTPPPDLHAKLANPAVEVIAIGGPYSPFRMATLAIGMDIFTKQQVWQAIEELAGRTDQQLAQFPEPEMLLPRLTLVHAVMDHFDMSQVRYTPTVGSTLGILMTGHFWVAR